jgi:hypothetical protein
VIRANPRYDVMYFFQITPFCGKTQPQPKR